MTDKLTTDLQDFLKLEDDYLTSISGRKPLVAYLCLLAIVFTGVAILVALLARRRQIALGIALGVWIFFELIYGVLMLATTLPAGECPQDHPARRPAGQSGRPGPRALAAPGRGAASVRARGRHAGQAHRLRLCGYGLFRRFGVNRR